MTTTTTAHPACRVLRCLAPAAWRLVVIDDGREVTSGDYCGAHAAQHVAALPLPGRTITLTALPTEGAGR